MDASGIAAVFANRVILTKEGSRARVASVRGENEILRKLRMTINLK